MKEANSLLNPMLTIDEIRVTLDCAFRWIPYNYRSNEGNTYYWIEDQIGGECGIAKKINGVWLNISG